MHQIKDEQQNKIILPLYYIENDSHDFIALNKI